VCIPPFTFNITLLIRRSPYELDGQAELTVMILPDTDAFYG
jgi:hypothetical protein